MANMTVSLPDPIKEWIELQVANGAHASASDYLRDLVTQDRLRRKAEFSMDELRDVLSQSRSSGVGSRTVSELFAVAEDLASRRRAAGE